jgi:hypothetical protein
MCAMSTPPRPPQTTFLAGVVIVGGLLVVMGAFERVAQLRTLEMQQTLAETIDDVQYRGLGLDVSDLQTLLHVGSMVAAASAVAMAVLGWFVLQRSRQARVGLAVLSVPLVISTLLTADFLAPVVVMASVMLWMQPSRDWFNGVTPPPRPEPAEREAAPSSPVGAPPAYPPIGAGPSGEPRPFAGFGTAAAPAPYAFPAQPTPDRRPSALVWACVLTWIFSGLVAIGLVVAAVELTGDPDRYLDEARQMYADNGTEISEDLLVASALVMVAGFVVWCAAAAVCAWFAYRRHVWAQVTTATSAGVAGAGFLLMSLIAGPVFLVPLAACSVSLALLLRPEVRRWYASRGTMRP